MVEEVNLRAQAHQESRKQIYVPSPDCSRGGIFTWWTCLARGQAAKTRKEVNLHGRSAGMVEEVNLRAMWGARSRKLIYVPSAPNF